MNQALNERFHILNSTLSVPLLKHQMVFLFYVIFAVFNLNRTIHTARKNDENGPKRIFCCLLKVTVLNDMMNESNSNFNCGECAPGPVKIQNY